MLVLTWDYVIYSGRVVLAWDYVIYSGRVVLAWDYVRGLVLICSMQWESGTDLGLLLVNHLKERHSPITEDTLGTVCMEGMCHVIAGGQRLLWALEMQ